MPDIHDYLREIKKSAEAEIAIPRWACWSVSVTARSPLEHVNRYYWIEMRRLNCLKANATWLRNAGRCALVQALVEDTKAEVTAEFKAWKEANGYDA